ncbi:hypothetical protein [Lactobacillus sp. wkB10]|uniref:hypothetical protein n=1 Tax=Lactobacillus sp. wkB10 TaxID=1545701 RepID=UPI0005143B1A|nr:hypothetical protein [Lactobacillus sp. wkB10]KGG54235.1 hypothetical protein LACWKB10_0862 [Lactobacillus sp. wkB10]
MIQDDTKQTFKFLAWVFIILIFLYFAFIVIFYKAGNPERSETRELNRIAIEKTPIKYTEKNYHLNRGVNSYALKGLTKDHKTYYFIYLPGSKKAYLYSARRGVNEGLIRNKYIAKEPNEKITEVNLGWYKNKPVWEVSSKNIAGEYHYQLYNFKDGKLVG